MPLLECGDVGTKKKGEKCNKLTVVMGELSPSSIYIHFVQFAPAKSRCFKNKFSNILAHFYLSPVLNSRNPGVLLLFLLEARWLCELESGSGFLPDFSSRRSFSLCRCI